MNIFKRVNATKNSFKVIDFINQITPTLKADLAFQSSEFSRWKPEQGQSFITSVILGQAPSKFIFADVKKCYDYAVKKEQKFDIDYYKKWLDLEVTLLNLDSNNRTINILSFVKGELGIQHGKYFIDGEYYDIKKGNDKYTDLLFPKALKECFEESYIDFDTYTDTTRDQLSDIFERINDGKPLNAPEKRNARTSQIANVIRELSEEFGNRFFSKETKWFKSSDKIRRGLDDFISGLSHIFFEGKQKPINDKNLNDMYRVGSVADIGAVDFKNKFKSFMRWVSEKNLNAIPNRNSILDLFVIYIDTTKDKLKLKEEDTSKFIKEYIRVVGELLKDQTFKTNPFQKDAKEQKTFERMVGGRQFYNNLCRNQLILEKLKLDDYFVKLDNTRVVNDNMKLAAAVRDNFKTAEGKDIDLSKLQTNQYHKGHRISHISGGQTNLDNTVIQEDMDNWKTGKKTVTA